MAVDKTAEKAYIRLTDEPETDERYVGCPEAPYDFQVWQGDISYAVTIHAWKQFYSRTGKIFMTQGRCMLQLFAAFRRARALYPVPHFDDARPCPPLLFHDRKLNVTFVVLWPDRTVVTTNPCTPRRRIAISPR